MTLEKRIDKVNAYPLYGGKDITAFEVSTRLSLSKIAQILHQSKNITNLCKRKWFSPRSDIHIRFDYCNQPFIVYEYWGDCDVYWIGPEDSDNPKVDIQEIFQLFIDAKLTHYLK